MAKNLCHKNFNVQVLKLGNKARSKVTSGSTKPPEIPALFKFKKSLQ